jgi:hypothetical protein
LHFESPPKLTENHQFSFYYRKNKSFIFKAVYWHCHKKMLAKTPSPVSNFIIKYCSAVRMIFASADGAHAVNPTTDTVWQHHTHAASQP